jgi:RNA ligase (TIGR02306 family)
MTEYVRKMASIQLVNGVFPIENADKICQYGINGWRVVDQVGKYKIGDVVIFAEIDCWIPTEIAPFLSKGKEPREYMNIRGERLRTIKLRGALSQGLILPLTILPQNDFDWNDPIGTDVSQMLGIVKWEPPTEFLSADTKGSFPSYCPKSDQERVQNCFSDVSPYFENYTFEVTEKVEGQSHSAIFYEGEFQVCSRNLSLKDSDNTFWNSARKYDLENKMRALGRNLMIQSEQVGPGISGNIYKLKEYFLYVYDIFDIDTQKFLSPIDRKAITKFLGLTDVPVLWDSKSLQGETCASLLKSADGKSVLGVQDTLREGLVFKLNSDNRVSFKAVSDQYLLKES